MRMTPTSVAAATAPSAQRRRIATATERPEHGDGDGGSWLDRLQELFDRHAHVTANQSRVASSATKEARIMRLVRSFRDLRELGYKLRDPINLKQKHVIELVRYWEEKGLAASTIQNRVSALRNLCQWIGKEGMVKETAFYASSRERVKVTTSATTSKAWSDHGIDVAAKLAEVATYDAYVGMQLRTCVVFGLRRKEAVMIKPHRSDRGDVLMVTDGTKGGRDRLVLIDSPLKREVLDLAKEMVGPRLEAHLGGPRIQTLKQALRRYDYVLGKCGISRKQSGVTGHGLRHEYMNNRYEEISGEKSPVRGGVRPPPAVEERTRAIVAEEAGHTRTTITSAYYGTFKHLAHVAKTQERTTQSGCDSGSAGATATAGTAIGEEELEFDYTRLVS